ncbi:MAG: RNA 2',3'-cyclic phosphodiesterase [Candidatus Marinimicrobia bacterium]|nr:RNA 2',3'-cyclic phosphodiesterase [Candidatus Neomarinimicrobiota bacterium]MBL7023629.1 RNA 2',3'-cyclic phosphodiesterase [Candidatus Neomarinimicrobiota bacterium]MBL7109816.1 RNA 2',3'-cyclic phosphodiesterase [Candidatus Neomarinimicrobiota bacterium]
MTKNTKRLFIGIEVSPKVNSLISSLKNTIISERNDIRWVHQDNLHITISFLGNVQEENIPKLINLLTDVIQFKSYKMSIEQTGIFPNEKRLRILWIGINKGKNEIINLQYKIDKSVVEYKQSQRLDNFKPHITVGRVKRNADLSKIQVKNFLNTLYEPIEFNVNSVVLFESKLHPEGAKYTILKEFPLNERSKQ